MNPFVDRATGRLGQQRAEKYLSVVRQPEETEEPWLTEAIWSNMAQTLETLVITSRIHSTVNSVETTDLDFNIVA